MIDPNNCTRIVPNRLAIHANQTCKAPITPVLNVTEWIDGKKINSKSGFDVVIYDSEGIDIARFCYDITAPKHHLWVEVAQHATIKIQTTAHPKAVVPELDGEKDK